MEWELSKENVQPLKSGHNVEVLNDALKAKAEGPARSSVLEEQNRQFLEAIVNYVGDDPLSPWIKYIKWINDAYPAGGAQSELLKQLERCTRQFIKDARYRRDMRYLKIWVQYADCCSDPSEVFPFLEANNIGQDYALFYQAYATSMEIRRKFSTADEIYNLGLQRSAHPLGRLESMYKGFLHRMLRRGERKLRDEQRQAIAGNPNEIDVLSRSFGPTAVDSEDSMGQQILRQRARPVAVPPARHLSSRPTKAALSVFVDPEFGGLPTSVSAQEACVNESQAAWSHIPSVVDKTKENVQRPSKWTEAKIGQEAHGQLGSLLDLKVLADEEFAEDCNHKPRKVVTKSAAPRLRLRLEDMPKTRRRVPDLQGPFLDFPEAGPAFTTQGPTQCLSGSSENVSVRNAASSKSHAETVFGYDSSLLSANGIERSFEEVRLSIYETRQVLHFQEKENKPTAIADPEKSKDFHLSPQSSFNPDPDWVKESRRSTELKTEVTGNVVEESILQSSCGQRNVDSDDDGLKQKSRSLSESSNQQGVINHTANSDCVVIVDCLSKEPGEAKENPLNTSQLESQQTSLPSTRPDEAPIVHVNSFASQGDETVAIKRFAEEVIVQGSDPKANSIDTVSHHGLVEPTINTKEALADILDMFNKPLECDNIQPKVRKPKDKKTRSSNPTAKSSGFEIFADEGLGVQIAAKTEKREKRAKAVSGRSSAAPVVQTSGFQVCQDENSDVLGPRVSRTNVRTMTTPFDSISGPTGLHIHHDVDLDGSGTSNLNNSEGNEAGTSSKSLLDPAFESRGFDIFVDEDLNVSNSRRGAKTVTHPAFGSSAFEIGADDDLIVKEPLRPAENSCAFEILGDDNLGMEGPLQRARGGARGCELLIDDDLVMNRPLQQARIDDSSPLQILAGDALVMKRPLQPTARTLRESAAESSSGPSTGVDDELRELSLISDKLDADAIKNRSGGHLSVVEDKLTARNNFGIDDSEIHEAAEETSKDMGVSSKVNDAELRMPVNPWDERNLQNLLNMLQPQMIEYEGFLGSDEKYDGSIPISSAARNKVLQLGNSRYHLKGCAGHGAFAQVFIVEDEDDDLSGNAIKLALKFQKPACPWEFYIYRQLDMRIFNEDRCYYGQVRRFHLYSDSSFMICIYGDKGTLQDVVNAYISLGQRMEEVLCIYYTIEMLRMLEILHGVGIIHGDFKPDNLLIRDDSNKLEVWTPDRRGCWKYQGLTLIDWGRSIDLSVYPEGIQFTGDCKTDSFRCPEMLEHRPWRFQVDTFGLCGVVHCLLHGSYMQIEKSQTADGQIIYRPKSPYRRYWNITLWREFFETLLNVTDCAYSPASLSALRKNFEDHLTGNSLGKKVKEMLWKQTIMSRPSLLQSGLRGGMVFRF